MIATKLLHRAASAFGAACIALTLAAFSSTAWAQAGYVHEVSGTVSIQKASAKARLAKTGDTFESETLFRTGADGKLILKFADGQVVALRMDSALRVGRYRYVANNLRLSASTLELMKGEMRFVTGLIGVAHREGIHITAGNSTIEIQKAGGADFTVAVNPDPQEFGRAAVALGEISVSTPYGPIYRIASGQYVPWQPGRAPPLAAPIAAAPAVVQAATADLWATVLPTSTPVEVTSAARIVSAVAAARAQAGASADPSLAGYVDAISNQVSIQTPSGRTATATVGTTFAAGSSFDTGSDGRVVLKFADGQLVALGQGSVLTIAQYQYDPGDVKASRSALELASGAMRFVSGYIHAENPAGLNITAGASRIDIRNTGAADFTVAVDTEDQEVGLARVTLGEISVYTPYGLIDQIALEQSSLWGPGKTTSPVPEAQALALVQAAVALQLAELPDNAPVAVAQAAAAAATLAQAKQAQAAASADPQNARLAAEAQAATELANLATEAAAAASEAAAGKAILATLESLQPTAAGPVLAQAPSVLPVLRAAPILPTVTPGAGGGCTGSKC